MRVCVLGSGLTALTLAKALVNQNIYVDIFSLNHNNKIDRSRTVGISNNNCNYIDENIINTKKIGWKLKKIEIFSDNLKNEKILNFQKNNEQLFSVFKNFQLHELLNKSLSRNKFCKKLKFKYKPKSFDDYNLVFVTDPQSMYTKKYFNKKIFKSYNSLAFTTTIKHEKISNDVATQIFTKRGPLAFLPVSKKETSIVYSIPNSKKVIGQNVNKLIQNYNFKYKIKKIDNINSFELKSFILRSYYNKKILAFGDLLHRIHPLAGQGFNMTIRDIKVLVDIIKEKLELGLPLDSSVNYNFEKKIKHKNYIFSNGIDLIHEFFNLERKFNNKILSKSLKYLGNNSSLNKFFIKIADKGIY